MRWGAVWLLAGAGCAVHPAPVPARPAVAAAPAPTTKSPPASPPSDAPEARRTCVITGESLGGHTLFATPERDRKIAEVWSVLADVTDRYQVSWTELGVGLRAGRVSLRNPGVIRLTGYADAGSFYLRDRQVIIEDHVWIRPTTRVDDDTAAVEGDEVTFAISSMLVPSLRRARTRCSNVSYGRPADTPSYGPVGRKSEKMLTGDEVRFFDAPNGNALWSLRRAGVTVYVVEERDDHSRVFEMRDVVVDAWVPSSQLRAVPPEPAHDRLSCDDCQHRSPKLRLADESSAYPERVRVPRDAAIGVGKAPGGPAVGFLEPGAIVRVQKRLDGWIGFGRIRGIEPPTGELFWVSSEAVEVVAP